MLFSKLQLKAVVKKPRIYEGHLKKRSKPHPEGRDRAELFSCGDTLQDLSFNLGASESHIHVRSG